jgi:hypothetical protein
MLKRGSPHQSRGKRSSDARRSPLNAPFSAGGAARDALSQERPLDTPNILRETYQFSSNGTVFSMPTHEVVVTCNKLAMTALSQENFKECQIFLKRAEGLVTTLQEKLEILGSEATSSTREQVAKLYSLTMNNLGCYYKK